MKVVIAPDSFKGSLSAPEVAGALADGVMSALPDSETVRLPVADGGEGTVGVMLEACGGELRTDTVEDPLGRPCEAAWGILPDGRTAIIELAAASGLTRISESERDPWVTSSYGTGQLIERARARGCDTVLLGIGGSATVDGGAGILEAIGVRLLTADSARIPRGGGGLVELSAIDASEAAGNFRDVEIHVLCDVENPLVGESGAAAVFGPQKGASPKMVADLERALTHYAAIVERDLGVSIAHVPRCGAAGGAGAALHAAVGASLARGIDAVLETMQLRDHLCGADLVIVGEGKMDHQTLQWKAPYGVAQLAAEVGVPVLAVVGDAAQELPPELTSLFVDIIRIRRPGESIEKAIAETIPRLNSAGAEAAERLT